MTGSVDILHIPVVLGPGILVGDAEGQRAAGRLSFPEAAQPFYFIGFSSGRGQLGLSGLSSAQFECNSFCIDLNSGGQSVDDPTDRISVGLPKSGEPKMLAERVACHGHKYNHPLQGTRREVLFGGSCQIFLFYGSRSL